MRAISQSVKLSCNSHFSEGIFQLKCESIPIDTLKLPRSDNTDLQCIVQRKHDPHGLVVPGICMMRSLIGVMLFSVHILIALSQWSLSII